MWRPAEAVKIYRLGGEDYASFPLLPEVAAGSVEFEQLSWADVDPAQAGDFDSVNLAGVLAPYYYGSDESILATVEERGGFLMTERYSGYGRDPTLNVVADGDFTTFFLEHNASLSDYSPGGGITGFTLYFDLGGLFPLNRVAGVAASRLPKLHRAPSCRHRQWANPTGDRRTGLTWHSSANSSARNSTSIW